VSFSKRSGFVFWHDDDEYDRTVERHFSSSDGDGGVGSSDDEEKQPAEAESTIGY
jgi:hypothetical protein